MIGVACDRPHRVVVLEFKGDIGADEAKETVDKLEKTVPPDMSDITVLTDFSDVGTMDVEFENQVKRSMKLLAEHHIKRVARVLPDPNADVSFALLSRFFLPDVEILTFRSRAEADSKLGLKTA